MPLSISSAPGVFKDVLVLASQITPLVEYLAKMAMIHALFVRFRCGEGIQLLVHASWTDALEHNAQNR
jgi:hypothetical protein